MDIDKSLDAMEGWAYGVFAGLTGNKTDPAKIIELCKNINAEGRKLEYRRNGIKHYDEKLKEAKKLAQSVEEHFKERNAAWEEFRKKHPYWGGSGDRSDDYILGYNRCEDKTEYQSDFHNTTNKLGHSFYGGTYVLAKGRQLLMAYASFITSPAVKTEIEFVKKTITEMRAAAQVIMNVMEKITKLAKDKKNQDQLKVKTDALYASVKKVATSMYNTSLREMPVIGGKEMKVILRELRFNSERDLNGANVNVYFNLDLSEIIDYIKDHLKNCKKKTLS